MTYVRVPKCGSTPSRPPNQGDGDGDDSDGDDGGGGDDGDGDGDGDEENSSVSEFVFSPARNRQICRSMSCVGGGFEF